MQKKSLQNLSDYSSDDSNRLTMLTDWLMQDNRWHEGKLTSLDGDASFRRYYRWHRGAETAMIMDAPPPKEDIRPFLHVQHIFSQLSVLVPEIYRYDSDRGFIVLQDFGDQLFSQAVASTSESVVDTYYQQALSVLASWQSHSRCESHRSSLPQYHAGLLVQEMQLLPDWFLDKHLSQPFTRQEMLQWQVWQSQLVSSALAQPVTLVHRDYHSRNLMVTEHGLGIIDFQDAVQGALTYDAVSLLKDAYVTWPADQVTEWLRAYFLQLVASGVVSRSEWNDFVQAFDWMGIQRHLKVLGIFARLAYRDGKMKYLDDLPVVAQYLWQTAMRYPQLKRMAEWIERCILPRLTV